MKTVTKAFLMVVIGLLMTLWLSTTSAWAAPRESILYTDGDGLVYRVSPDGTSQAQVGALLTAPPARAIPSRDGTSILSGTAAVAGSSTRLFSSTPDGSGATEYNNSAYQYSLNYAFSPAPAGTQIAFSGRPTGTTQYRSIFLMNAADHTGASIVRLSTATQRDHVVLDWGSPGIMYTGAPSLGALSVIDPASGVSRQILSSTYSVSDARFFTVGSVTKAVIIARTLSTNPALYIIPDVATATSTTIPTALTTSVALTGVKSLAPSLDGTSVAVIASNTPTNATYQVWNVNLSTGTASPLIDTKLGSNGSTANYLSWGMMEDPGTPTTISTANVSGVYSDPVTLTAQLVRQADGLPVAGQTVTFKVNGVPLPQTGTTDAAGYASVSYTIDLPAGSYSIEAAFAGTLAYGASTTAPGNNRTLTVTREGGTLAYTGDLMWAASVNLKATLTEVPDPTPGDLTLAGTVDFLIKRPDGGLQTTVSAPVAADGTALATVALPNGAYQVVVHLHDNLYYSAADMVAYIQASTVTTPTLVAVNAIYSDPTVLKATVQVSGGGPAVVGEPVDIVIRDAGGVTVAANSVNTDSAGAATWNYTPDLKAGTYTVTYSHPATSYYLASSGSATLTVAEEGASLSYTGDTSWNSSVVLKAQITETADLTPGQVSKAGTVIFTVTQPDGTPVGAYPAPITGAGASGTATYTVALPAGPYKVQAGLSPSNGYYTAAPANGVIDVTTKLTVTAPGTAYSDLTTLGALLTLQDGLTPVAGEGVVFTVKDSANVQVATGTGTTLADGKATFAFTPMNKAGAYTVSVTYGGSSYYKASSGSAGLTVGLETATMAYTGPSLWTGSAVTLTASVDEVADSAPGDITKLNGKVQFIVKRPDNSTVGTYPASVTGATGSGTASYNATLPAGAYAVTVHVDPTNGFYQAADVAGTIKADTTMTMPDGNGVYSDPVNMTATLTVTGGSALSGAPVTFTVTDSTSAVVKTGSGTTDLSGKVTLSFIDDLPAGTYTVTAQYANTTFYNTSSATATLAIGVEDAVLAYTGTTAWSGTTVTLSATVNETGSDGHPGVINKAGSVNFVVTKADGSPVGTYPAPITGAGGNGTAATTASLPAGAYNVSVELPANPYYQAPAVGAIIKVGTALTMAADTVQYSDQRTMKATLSVAGGAALGAGFPVTFSVKDALGAQVGTGSTATDGNGDAFFTFDADVKAGTYTVRADYGGNSYYNASNVSANLVVTLEDAGLTYTGDLLWMGNTVNLSATVAETPDLRAGQITKASSVSFIVTDKNGNPKGTFTALITGAGASGTATTTATLPAGGYNVLVRLNPSNGYYQAADVPATIKVNTALTVAPVGVDYSDTASLQATLKFPDGTAVAGEMVTFAILDAASTVIATDTKQTSSTGVATLSFDADVVSGPYTVQADYAASTHYNASSGSGTLTVQPEKATLAYTGDNVWSSSITLSATIIEEGAPDTRKGDITKAGNLDFIVTKPDGTPVNSFPAPITGTSGNGSASTTVALPAGIYVVKVHLDPANGYYQASDVVAGIRADTATVLTLPPVHYSDQTAIAATVTLNDGTPVAAGETVNFTMKDSGGTTIKTGSDTTDASGVAHWVFPVGVKAGAYTVVADYPGGLYYNPSNKSGTLTVTAEDASLSYTGPTLWTSPTVTLSASISEVADDPWPGDITKAGSLTFTVTRPDGSTAATVPGTVSGSGATGTASANVTLGAGAYMVTVHLDSANGYYQAGTDATGYIKANTSIQITPAPIAYSDRAPIQATLKVTGGSAVGAGEQIAFTVKDGGGAVVGSGTVPTDVSGVASFAFDAGNVPAGNYTVTADYAGPSSYYNSSSASSPLTVDKEGANLAYTGDATWSNAGVQLKASITEVADSWPGQVDKAGSLQFVVQRPDGFTETTTTAPIVGAGASGTATKTISLPSNGYKVTVKVDPANNYYTALDAVGYIKADTLLSVSAPATKQFSDVANITATLSVAGGSPVGAGENVIFTIKDGANVAVKTSGPVATDSSGVAAWAYKVDLPQGDYTVVADYGGLGNYYSPAPTSTPVTLSVALEDATLAYTGDTAWASTVTLKASVTDAADLSSGDVTKIGNHVQFMITLPDGTPVQTETATVTGTPANGSATATVSGLPVGAYKVTVALDAANGYYQATANPEAYLTVNTQLTVTPPASVQYSDQVDIVADLKVAGGGPNVGAGEPVVFVVKDGGGVQQATQTVPTDSGGTATWHYKPDLPSGTYKVTASYAGSAFYNGSNSGPAVDLVVTKETATLAYTGPATWTSSLTLTAKLDDAVDPWAGNIANAGGSIHFLFERPDGSSLAPITAPLSGGPTTATASVTTSAVPAGGYKLTASLPSNNYYTATDAITYLKANTTLTTTTPPDVAYSDSSNLTASLKVAGTSAAVAGETVTFTVTDSANTQVAQGTAATDANGDALWKYVNNLPAGTYTVTVSYGNTTYYNAAPSVTTTLTVVQEQATLAYTGPTAWASSLTLSASITEQSDLTGGNVSLAGDLDFVITKPDGSPVQTITRPITGTGTTGTATASNVTLPAGAYKVTVQLPDNSYYQAGDAIGQIRIGTALSVANAGPEQYSDHVNIVADLTVVGGGGATAGETVNFTIKDGSNNVVDSGSALTDGAGKATWDYKVNLPQGAYTVWASYGGNTYYDASTSTAGATLTITPEDATLAYTGPTTYAASLSLTATVTDDTADGSLGDVSLIGDNKVQFVLRRPDGSVEATLGGTLSGGPTTATAAATAAVPANGYKVTVQLDSSNGYYQAAARAGYIKADTAITVANAGPVEYSDQVTLSAQVKVASGPGIIAGETVMFVVKNSANVQVATGTGTTNGTGTATWTWTVDQPAGTYTVTATYAGGTYYNAQFTSTTGTVSVTKEKATLTYLGPSVWTSGSMTLTARIDDESPDSGAGDLQKAGGAVTFVFTRPDSSAAGSVPGVIGPGTTTATATGTTSTLSANGYKVTVQLGNNNYYTAADATGYIQADMSLVVDPAGPVKYSDTVDLTATLSVTGGSTVGANEQVIFKVKDGLGNTLATSPVRLTNGSGVASWTYKVDVPAATYKVEASYAGGTYYKQVTSAPVDLTVTLEDATITTAASVDWAASLNLTATITEIPDVSGGDVALIGNHVQFIITKPDNSPVQTVTTNVTGSGTTGTATATVALPNGGYKVRVHIDPANGYYQATDALSNIKTGTSLVVTAPAAKQYSDVANIQATLSESGGGAVGAGESVTITVANGSGTPVATYTDVTNGAGQVNWAWKVDQPYGSYSVTATYTATAYYGASTSPAAPIQVQLEDAALTYQSPKKWTSTSVTLTAKLDDDPDSSAGDVSKVGSGVKFEVRTPDGTLVNTYTGTVSGSGTSAAVTAAATLPANAYQVKVLIDPANGYYTATPVTDYITADTALTVATPSGSVPYSDTINLSATLSVAGGSPVGAGEPVTFTVLNSSNVVVASSTGVTTSSSGVANWTFKADLPAGNYTVKASYTSASSYYNSQPTSNQVPLTVTKEAATLSYIGPTSWTGSSVTLTAQINDDPDLMDGNIQNVGSAVTFVVAKPDGSPVGSYPGTLGAGTASAQVTANATLPKGAYKVTVQLGTNNYYQAAADAVGYIMADMDLTIAPINAVPYSDTTVISATLAVAGGGPAVGSGEQITFTVKDGATTVLTYGPVPTNSSGVATWTYTNALMAKTYTVEASHAASTYYNAITSAPENLVVTLENATVTPQADVNWAASLNLTATIAEQADLTPGVITNIGNNVQFVITKPDNSPQTTLTANVNGSGLATATAALPNGAYKVTVQIDTGNGYYQSITANPIFYIKAGSTMSVTAPASRDYSDVAAFTAKLTVSGTTTGIDNVPVVLTVKQGATTVATQNLVTDGTGSVAWNWKVDQPAGSYSFTAAYAGDSYYGTASASQSFTVTQEKATVTYLGPTTYTSSPLTLQASITDFSDGSAGDVSKVGAHVRFNIRRADGSTVGSYPATVPASGTTAVVTASVPLPPNGYDVTVDIDPSDLYYVAETPLSMGYIQATTTLSDPTVSPASITYSNTTSISSKLQVSGGGGIASVPITFTIFDATGTTSLLSSSTVTTDGAGTATWSFTDTTLPAGTYKVRADYGGNSYFTSASSTFATLTITKETATFNFPGPLTWSNSVTLSATVFDDPDGSPGDVQKLAGGGVVFVVDKSDGTNFGTFPATSLTGGPASGTASVSVTLPKGGYKVTVQVDGSNGFYQSPSPVTQYIRLDTSMSVTPSSATIDYSDVINLSTTVNLTGSGGGNVGANQTVTYTVKNSANAVVTTQNVTTNASGVAAWPYQHLLGPAGNYTIEVTFAASGYYNAAPMQTVNVVVNKEKATIADTAVSFTGTGSPQSLTLKATLTQDPDGYSGDLTKAVVVWTFTPTLAASGVNAMTFQASADASGVATTTASVPNWPFTISAQVDPTNQYWQSAAVNRSIKGNPLITLSTVNVQFSDKPSITATLTSGGIPVPNRTVVLSFDSTGPGGGSSYQTVSGVPNTNASGVTTQWYDLQIIWPAQTWTNATRATFAGDGLFNAAPVAYGDAVISPEDATISATATNGSTNIITITITEATDTPNPGAMGNPAGGAVQLRFTVQSKKNGTGTWTLCNANAGPATPTGNPATATFSLDCSSGVGPGQHDIWIELNANGYYTSPGFQMEGGVILIQSTSPVVTYGGTTTLSASVNGGVASTGGTAAQAGVRLASLSSDIARPMRTLQGSLVAKADEKKEKEKGGGKPPTPPGLVGQPIEFFVDGVSVGTALIGEDGTANLPYKPDLAAGQYTIEAKFHGNAKNGPASGTGLLTVLARTGVLQYTGDVSPSQEGLALRARLSDGGAGADLTKATVRFTLTDAAGAVVAAYDAAVQPDGTAVQMAQGLKPGTYQVTVSLTDERYFTAAPVTADVTVPAPATEGEAAPAPPPAEEQATPTPPPAEEQATPTPPPSTGRANWVPIA